MWTLNWNRQVTKRANQAQTTDKDVLYGLGDNWWKQYIDGDVHHYGPRVFDEGLGQDTKEPGFLASIERGMAFVSDHLGKPALTEVTDPDKYAQEYTAFYKALHQTTCSHFQGSQNNTLISASEAGTFREEPLHSLRIFRGPLGYEVKEDYYCLDVLVLLEEAKEAGAPDNEATVQRVFDEWVAKFPAGKIPLKAQNLIDRVRQAGNIKTFFEEESAQSIERINAFEDKWIKSVRPLNAFAKQLFEGILDRPVAFKLEMDPKGEMGKDMISMDYRWEEEMDLDAAVSKVFKAFCLAMKNNPSEEEKLEQIALVFQRLDLLHPFKDGQGRTDLMLLSKMLTENGFHPVIMDQPYFATTATTKEWVDYLKQGLKRWEEEQQNISKLRVDS